MQRTGVHKPIIGVAITAVLAGVNYWIGDNRTHDILTSMIVAASFLLAAAVILMLTEDWYWRAVAVAVALGGTGLTYALIFGRAADLWDVNTLVTRSILRSALDFGGLLLGVCVLKYLYDRRQRGPTEPFIDFIDPRKQYRDGPG